MSAAGPASHKLLAPEVVQSSAMDCGPASLKCLLEGFGVPVSYGRLREACQTDVDGTSIDTLEEVAQQLGMEADQIVVPIDHVLRAEAPALPAVAVVRLPSGLTHFVVLWRCHGPLVQLMDPGTGRRWTGRRGLLRELYLHETPVAAADWLEYATSADFLDPLGGRLAALGLPGSASRELIERAAEPAAGWLPLATLDAGVRMVDSLVQADGIRRGAEARRMLEASLEQALAPGEPTLELIPPAYWSAQPLDQEGADAEQELLLRGAVLLRVRGPRAVGAARGADDEPGAAAPLPPDLVAALEERPPAPGRRLLGMLRTDGLLVPSVLMLALALAAGGVVFEALLFRGLLDLGQQLWLGQQRLAAVAALALFLLALAGLELPLAAATLRMGRRLEARLRVAFLAKIPRLGDRYFHSRLTSDMAQRGHSIHAVRELPALGSRLLRATFSLALTTAGIAWIDPLSAPVALAVAALSVALPLAAQPLLTERDLRVQTHDGALTRFYLDALLGLSPIRTHGAERSVRREHEGLLVQWASASLSLLRAAVAVQGVLALGGIGLACWLLFGYLGRSGEVSSVLLLVYWALNLPALGQQVAQVARQYPGLRSVTLRLMEPLGAPEQQAAQEQPGASPATAEGGASVELRQVTVRVAGHEILRGLDLTVAGGEQLAVVGPSGAGKSSLVGLLLGWHDAAEGELLVDGAPLAGEALDRLRQQTAWIDPSVQLWNRPLLDNLRYGSGGAGALPYAEVLKQADLRGLVEQLPDGLQTCLGEGGALVSGGEGQRVRLGRAMLRQQVRLAILDEPFRGLDRGHRRKLLARARGWWPGATLICVTHDVGDTEQFDRVVVVQQGRIIEDGPPGELAAQASSRYRALLDCERAVRVDLWSGDQWRHLRLHQGQVQPGADEEPGS